jgi:hypothetical protein
MHTSNTIAKQAFLGIRSIQENSVSAMAIPIDDNTKRATQQAFHDSTDLADIRDAAPTSTKHANAVVNTHYR